jgi:hypothetical protein
MIRPEHQFYIRPDLRHKDIRNLTSCFGLSWCGLTQIRPYIKLMFRPYHIFMRPTANPALYQMEKHSGRNLSSAFLQILSHLTKYYLCLITENYMRPRGVTIHFFHKRYVSRYLICITIRNEITNILGTVRFTIQGDRLRYKRYDAHFLKKSSVELPFSSLVIIYITHHWCGLYNKDNTLPLPTLTEFHRRRNF